MRFVHKIDKVFEFSLQNEKIISYLTYFPIYLLNAHEMVIAKYFLTEFASLSLIKSAHLAWE